jgi:transmembrane 9 superfamily member 2/4
VRVNQIPRQIPPQPWRTKPIALLLGGGFAFVLVFVFEVGVVVQSMWSNSKIYYVFGFLFLAFIMASVACSEIAMISCYMQLCSEVLYLLWFCIALRG